MTLHDGRGGERRDVGMVVGRGKLDHVHSAPVEIGNAAEDGVSLARGETARNRRAGAGREGGIEAVDVEAQVRGAMPDPAADALDHAADAERVERGGVEDLDAERI